MLTRGIIKYSFDAALKELKDGSVVIAVAIGKGKRKKLVLTAGNV